MSNYINYIEQGAIKLGDLAFEVGDFRLAYNSYSKALKTLQNYNGDRMAPIEMFGDLKEKLDFLSPKKLQTNSVLKYETWQLSKSSFVKGEQCVKYLFLDKHKKRERTPFDKKKLKLFKQGHKFEDSFRDTEFPDGINIKEKVGNFAYFNSYTNFLIKYLPERPLYEATIIEDDVLIMCDVLISP